MTMILTTRPEPSEAAPYYFGYIDLIPEGDICETLASQRASAMVLLRSISDERSLYRYAPDKWSIREILGHLNDTERLFVSRAFWFARGFDTPLPSFDQHVAVRHAESDARSWSSHLEEFEVVRAATLAFFRGLPAAAWVRRGIASDNLFTVRALAFLAAGHVTHHLNVLNKRYL